MSSVAVIARLFTKVSKEQLLWTLLLIKNLFFPITESWTTQPLSYFGWETAWKASLCWNLKEWNQQKVQQVLERTKRGEKGGRKKVIYIFFKFWFCIINLKASNLCPECQRKLLFMVDDKEDEDIDEDEDDSMDRLCSLQNVEEIPPECRLLALAHKFVTLRTQRNWRKVAAMCAKDIRWLSLVFVRRKVYKKSKLRETFFYNLKGVNSEAEGRVVRIRQRKRTTIDEICQ